MTSDERHRIPPISEADDARLAEEAMAGSREALAEVFRRYGNLVYGAARRITGSHEDAEDVVQDVFVGLSRALGRYSERGRLRGWLRTLAVRTALMKVRAREHTPTDPLPPDATSPASSPDLAVDRVALQQLLDEMPETLRVPFVLREVEGYSHREVADLLGIRPGTSRVRLHRAWAFLEAELREDA